MAGTVLTNKGIALIAKLLASGQELIFTRAGIGTGRVPTGYEPQGMNGLNEYKVDGKISSFYSEQEIASVIFQISSSEVEEGFTVTEAGLFAQDPDEGEILYAYLDMTQDPQYIYAKGGEISKFAEIELQVVVGRVDKVTASVDPHSILTKGGDISDTKISTFVKVEQENTFPLPEESEDSKTLWGKVRKFFADFLVWQSELGTAATYGVADNLETTAEGFVLDARQGKVLKGDVNTLNSNLNIKVDHYDADTKSLYLVSVEV